MFSYVSNANDGVNINLTAPTTAARLHYCFERLIRARAKSRSTSLEIFALVDDLNSLAILA